ncbi:PP2C family serine/threonine-protein phosphatase [Leifsonia sp. TF02-11]|uniref:PP2C family protein-serine/threonine phosphatase n=1 Tax=Leifsonia sp. TF02-11 TaxID=2815212 RepID=UPI001AA18696|nr:PP2C family serine/threonine-protein phosphatase [Leifsonia sp. TF02-11]MBN9632217.1 serine/threonine-protein phosphatase [Actinomycetota bacterium]MBO1737736.1 serine/threonine-protein phosphatase [Leifsonia sp. TF02-11]
MAANRAAAVSHTGKIRSNNQDSGYAGRELFVVADGMGGHAGGDVASAIAVNRIREADGDYETASEAEFALQSALIAANSLLAETVFEHPELTGMGTTVSALLRVGDEVAIAHIGDSRIYLFREGELSQVSVDHTFVQRLVDSGRITEEEAMVHPRRSVLMRVLGDVDASPEIDTLILATRPGDRWLICSDGLSGVVKHDDLLAALASKDAPKQVADRLVKQSLDAGAPDNVTVVILDIGDVSRGDVVKDPVTVGSASAPLQFGEPKPTTRAARLPTLRLHPVRPATGPTHFEPESDDYLDELIEEDERRARRRRLTWMVGLAVLVIAIVLAVLFGYQWTQSRFFVGASPAGKVAIYQGVQQNLGPIVLSHVYEESDVPVKSLPQYDKQLVQQTINADDLAAARAIVDQLTDAAK